MREYLSEIKIRSWYEDVQIVEIEPQYIVLMVPTEKTVDFVRNERGLLEKFLSQVTGEFRIVYVYSADKSIRHLRQIHEDIEEDLEHPELGVDPYYKEDERCAIENNLPFKPKVKKQEKVTEYYTSEDGGLLGPYDERPPKSQNEIYVPSNVLESNTDYTFSSFVIGPSNRFTYNACYAVATNPASAWNPLFIYGPSGVGKTHLLYAITNHMLKNSPHLKIVYIKSEEFTNRLVESFKYKDGPRNFRDTFRTADVLLIDDIQFIAGKEVTQEEFFHTFNELYESHKQIIMTADRPARDIKLLEDRLRTRFEMGLMADIQPPDYELRAAIIKVKSAILGMELPDDCVDYLAKHMTTNVRQIEGALTRVYARTVLYSMPISLALVMKSVTDLVTLNDSPKETVQKILGAVCSHYKVSVEDIKSKTKRHEVAEARHCAVYLIRLMTPLSLKQIGQMFERDHSTIKNSVDVIERRIMEEPNFEREIAEMRNSIRE